MTNQMIVAPEQHQLTINEMGNVFVKSGFFADTRDQAQAIVKILAGQELGISPIASMTGVYIVKGKPSLGANLIAGCVKRSGRYNYRVVEHTDAVCRIEFYEKDFDGVKFVKVGESKFTIEDAKRAGTQNLDRFPRNMLFARAMSNGAKWYCADIFAGGVYTPDELGAVVQYSESGEIEKVIEGEYKLETEPEPQPVQLQPSPKKVERPMAPEKLREMLQKKASAYGECVVSQKQIGLLASMIEVCFIGMDHADKVRHSVVRYLAGKDSLKDVQPAMVKAMLDFLKPIQDSGGAYSPDEMAVKEIKSVWTAALQEAGQESLPLD